MIFKSDRQRKAVMAQLNKFSDGISLGSYVPSRPVLEYKVDTSIPFVEREDSKFLSVDSLPIWKNNETSSFVGYVEDKDKFPYASDRFAINPTMVEGYTGSKIYTDPYGGGPPGIIIDKIPVATITDTAILAGEGYKGSPSREDVIARRNQDLLAGMPVYSEPPQKEYIPGGLADGKPYEDFCPVQLEMGTQVELEHVVKFTDKGNMRKPKDTDLAKAKEIAKDHLAEIPDYYDRLEKLEDEAKDEGVFIDVEALKKAGEFAANPAKVLTVQTPMGPMLAKEDFVKELEGKSIQRVPRNEEMMRRIKEASTKFDI